MNVPVEQAPSSLVLDDSGHGEISRRPEEVRFTLGGQTYAVFVRRERDSGPVQPSGSTDALLHFLDQAAEGGPAPNTWRAVASALNRVHDPMQDALASRLFQSCTALLDRLGDGDRAVVLAASGNLETLLRALEAPTVQEGLAEQDPFAPARVRWLEDQQRILAAEGGVLTTAELAKTLGITKEGVRQRAKRASLLSLPMGRALYFPVWQFTNTQEYKPLIGLRDVLHALSDYDAWGKAIFLLGGEPALDGARPIDFLRRGDPTSVLTAARQYGGQGAR
jgi:hypothetical protein